MFKLNVNNRLVQTILLVAFKINIFVIETIQRKSINRHIKTSRFPVFMDFGLLLIAAKFQFNFINFVMTFFIIFLMIDFESSYRVGNINLKADNPKTHLIFLQIKLSFILHVKEYCLCGFRLATLIFVALCQDNRVYKYEHSD